VRKKERRKGRPEGRDVPHTLPSVSVDWLAVFAEMITVVAS
jgi:hypothetical protein